MTFKNFALDANCYNYRAKTIGGELFFERFSQVLKVE